ncbi:MAG: Rhomboid family protein [Chlorobi bacterium]|nr:Rhomboid family protein [Chlorobiota bacterium]
MMGASTLSRKILIILVIFFFLDYLHAAREAISPILVLSPQDVFHGFQLWRLITYAILPNGFIGLIVAVVAFSSPGEELEHMLGTKQFGILLLLVVVFGALLHLTLFFRAPNVMLAGAINPALFVLVGFVYLYPRSETRFFFISIQNRFILYGIAVLTIGNSLYVAMHGMASPWLFFEEGVLGLTLGLIYFHMRFQKYEFMLGPIRAMERFVSGARAPHIEQKPASAPRRTTVPQPVRVRATAQKSVPREISDEERLNIILDKISEKSFDSLTDDEKRFLSDYSGRL